MLQPAYRINAEIDYSWNTACKGVTDAGSANGRVAGPPSSESIYADLTIQLTDRLLAFAEFEYNMKENENIRSGLGLEYTAQCWSVGVSYTEEIDDQAIAFIINLTPGSIG
jgi:lipopolysaccharide assembly outer membrane protein LptD (OstA)